MAGQSIKSTKARLPELSNDQGRHDGQKAKFHKGRSATKGEKSDGRAKDFELKMGGNALHLAGEGSTTHSGMTSGYEPIQFSQPLALIDQQFSGGQTTLISVNVPRTIPTIPHLTNDLATTDVYTQPYETFDVALNENVQYLSPANYNGFSDAPPPEADMGGYSQSSYPIRSPDYSSYQDEVNHQWPQPPPPMATSYATIPWLHHASSKTPQETSQTTENFTCNKNNNPAQEISLSSLPDPNIISAYARLLYGLMA